MNAIIPIAIGAVVLAALGRKKRGPKEGENGSADQNGSQNGSADQNGSAAQDIIVDEGEIESEGGTTYQYRVWSTPSGTSQYVGELLLDGNWTSGPMSNLMDEVLTALEEMADSMDPQSQYQPGAGACDDAEPGPFDWLAYNEATEKWESINDTLDPLEVMEPGRRWCVLPDDDLGGYFSRVVDEGNGEVIFESATVSDPNVAASMAYYGLYSPDGPFPWVKLQQQDG